MKVTNTQIQEAFKKCIPITFTYKGKEYTKPCSQLVFTSCSVIGSLIFRNVGGEDLVTIPKKDITNIKAFERQIASNLYSFIKKDLVKLIIDANEAWNNHVFDIQLDESIPDECYPNGEDQKKFIEDYITKHCKKS